MGQLVLQDSTGDGVSLQRCGRASVCCARIGWSCVSRLGHAVRASTCVSVPSCLSMAVGGCWDVHLGVQCPDRHNEMGGMGADWDEGAVIGKGAVIGEGAVIGGTDCKAGAAMESAQGQVHICGGL